MTVSSSAPNFGSMNPQTTATPPFPVPSGLPTIPGPPGLSPSSIDSTSAFLQRPSMPGHPSNAVVQPQTYPPYPSLHGMAPSPQGIWMQPQQMGGVSRPPFMHYPTVFPGPLPLPTQAIPRPATMPDSQPPGVSPAVTVHASPAPSSAQSHHVVNVPEMRAELPPGIDTKNHSDDAGSKDNAITTESLDAWTAHKTATGVVYYYNVVTGVSTYEKPPGFVGEPGKVPVHPTPISMENLPGTDWALVTTNDGKKYYHNVKTKLSSWQIPSEVVEVRKKQEVDLSKDVLPVPHSTLSTDKGSASSSLGTPALNTGGRDATPLRSSSTPGSSALDLIKKKLQESGAPVTSSPASASLGSTVSDLNGMRATETTKGLPSENNKDSLDDKKGNGNVSDSSTDSEDEDRGPTKEECIIQFKEMLKERGVAPFSKWEKELPKIVFDPRFKAIPSHSARRALFEHYVKTRAEEERKERRAAQKAAIEGFKQLLEEASEEIDHNTDYQTFREKWGSDPRFKVLDRKDRENLLNERVLPLKKAAKEKAQAEWAAAATSFKSMLRDRGDITVNSRWSRVKDCLRNDPRYKSVKYEDREVLFNEYISGLKAVEEEAEKAEKSKREEQDKLKERERELRKRKEREELEMERVRAKVRRKEAVTSFQALLVETIKDPQASWTESKTKLEKDPQGRASHPDLDPTDMEKLFRDHIKTLHERCVHEFKALLADVVTIEAAAKKTEDGKTVLDSWSTAKRLLKPDPRYNKMPRKERETLWRRHAEDMLRKQNSALDQKEDKHKYSSARNSADTGKYASGSRRN